MCVYWNRFLVEVMRKFLFEIFWLRFLKKVWLGGVIEVLVLFGLVVSGWLVEFIKVFIFSLEFFFFMYR